MSIKIAFPKFISEIIDAVIYLLIWANMWYIYDYILDEYVSTTNKHKLLRVYIIMLCVALLLLFGKCYFTKK